MLFSSHLPEENMAVSQDVSRREAGVLPAVLRRADLALMIVLVTIILSDVRGMLFAETTVFFYWMLALLTFLLPSLWVFGWLMRQAPRHVPFYVWIVGLVPAWGRSVVLFLIWWPGILIVLATLGTCVSFLQQAIPSWFSTGAAQYLAFGVLLLLATLLLILPMRLLRLALWIGGLFYLSVFVLVAFATIIALIHRQYGAGAFPHSPFMLIPTHFSWSLFGLALLCLFGLNGPLLLDGEMYGGHRFLRGSPAFLWWGALGSFLLLLVITLAWIVLAPNTQAMQTPLLQLAIPILGPRVAAISWFLLVSGIFSCALAYLLIFSRAFLLATRMGYLPAILGRMNHAGVPVRAILAQSMLVLCTAVLIFALAPALLQDFFPLAWVNELKTGDQFSLFTSIAGSLWCVLTALVFVFALWLCLKKRRRFQRTRLQRLALSVLCVFGGLTSLICALAPLRPDWPLLFFSHTHWFPLVFIGVTSSLALAWVISELPRRAALVRAREASLIQEKMLREELLHVYAREQELHQQLQASYDEVQRLYREQEQAARTDVVTGLFNHRAVMERLEQVIAQSQSEGSSFLLAFLDLDHFKAINDTWGHPAGDAALREVARRLRQALRPGDSAGRYGGEEFLLILAGRTLAQAREEGERLRRIMQDVPCHWQQTRKIIRTIEITASIGIAAYGIHGTQSRELLEQADHAMYQAKLAGRNCVRLAQSDKHISSTR